MSTLMTLLVKLGLDSSDFSSGIDKASGKAGGFGKTMGSIGKIAGGAIGATVATIGAVGGALATTIDPASDLAETMSKNGVVFGEWADDVEKFGEAAASSLGMSKNQALAATGTYGNLFRSMGIGVETSADMSMNLVQLASDLASFNNSNPTEVLDALRSGLSGETEPLKRLGVNLNQALIEQKALEMGLYDGNGALDAAAKAQATYALVMEQTGLAQGDFARTSDGLANKQRTIKAQFEDIKATIGTGLLPIVEGLTGGFSDLLGGIKGILGGTAPLEEKMGAIGDLIAGALNNLVANLPGVLDAGSRIILSLVEGMVLNLPAMMPGMVSVLMNIVTMIIELAPLILDAGLKIIVALAMGIAQSLPTLIPTIVQMLLDIVMVIVENIPLLLEAGTEIIIGLVDGILNALPLIIKQLPIIVMKIVEVIINSLPLLMDASIEIILALVQGIAMNLPALIRMIVELVVQVAATIVQNLPKLLEAGKQMLRKLIEGIKTMWPGIRDTAVETMNGFWEGLKSKFASIGKGIKDFGAQVLADLKDVLNIGSPSREMFNIGKNMMLGLALGLERYQVAPEGVTINAAGRLAGSTGMEMEAPETGYDGPSANEIGKSVAFHLAQLGIL